jgi:uroporphyrinogen-III synthase
VVETLTPGQYLRLAGEDRVTLTPPPGVRIETAVVYAAHPRPLPPEMAQALTRGGLVMLHSGAAARHFRQCCEATEIPKEQVRIACLAPRIASLAGEGWGEIGVANARTDVDLLELVGRMCQ